MSDFEKKEISKNWLQDNGHLLCTASEQEITKVTSKDENGKPYFTAESFQNSFAGFEQWMIVLARVMGETTGDQRKTQTRVLADAFKSFVRLDLILANRLYQGNKKFTRLHSDDYGKSAPVDQGAFTVSERQQHMRSLVLNVGQAYGKDWSALFAPIVDGKQNEYDDSVAVIETEIEQVVASDEGAKALQIIDQSTQRGIQEPKAQDALYRIPNGTEYDRDYSTRLQAPEKEIISKTTKDWKVLRKAYELNAMKLELDEAFTGENLQKVWGRMQENQSDFADYLKTKPEFKKIRNIGLDDDYQQSVLQNQVLAAYLKWEKLPRV